MITMGDKRLPSKEAEAARIAADVGAWLAAGNAIAEIPRGGSGIGVKGKKPATANQWHDDPLRAELSGPVVRPIDPARRERLRAWARDALLLAGYKIGAGVVDLSPRVVRDPRRTEALAVAALALRLAGCRDDEIARAFEVTTSCVYRRRRRAAGDERSAGVARYVAGILRT